MTDFDKLWDRRNTNSLKWNVGVNELPMWVADMDFPTAPGVIRAVLDKASSGIFGYQEVPDSWYDAIVQWWGTRHNWQIERDWLCFCTGVVPAITCTVKRLTNVGDNVLLLTPVYDIFFHSVENTGRHVLECPLVYDDGGYSVDFAALERALAHELTTLMVLCNPHNPVGKVWSRQQLAQIGKLCRKHGVNVISDEIHCDITAPGVDYVPFASASDDCRDISVTALSASKAFNLAGMQSAAVVVPNPTLRNAVVRGLNSDELAEPNAFAVESTVAAFTQGAEWLDELRAYIDGNRRCAEQFCAQHLPQLRVTEQQATYLLWIDCRALTDDSAAFCNFLRAATGLYLCDGAKYRGDGNFFVRMNVACPRSRLTDGLERLRSGVEQWLAARS